MTMHLFSKKIENHRERRQHKGLTDKDISITLPKQKMQDREEENVKRTRRDRSLVRVTNQEAVRHLVVITGVRVRKRLERRRVDRHIEAIGQHISGHTQPENERQNIKADGQNEIKGAQIER